MRRETLDGFSIVIDSFWRYQVELGREDSNEALRKRRQWVVCAVE